MTAAWLVSNVFAWSVQAAVLIAAGIAAARLFGWRHPQSRLRFYQLLLGASLLLPLLQPWHEQTTAAFVRGTSTVAAEGSALSARPVSSIEWEPFLLIVLGAGVVMRLVMLGRGLIELRSLRRSGRAIQIDGLVGVEVREVERLNGPAAFGWLHPVILLPIGMMDGPVRDAALQHELQHVLRRDWIENMIERAAASMLWFHPMAWWLLDRIHLTREQAVDAEVAGTGEARDKYLQVLLASAGLANLPAMPAASFIRRPRHLVERVAFLSKETTMSIRRTAMSAAMAMLVSGTAVTVASFYLPLQLSAQETAVPPLRWTRFAGIIEGTVMLEATVNSDGEVVDARVVSGPDELRRQALQSVLAWRYTKDAAARRVLPVTIDFTKESRPGAPAPGPHGPPPPPPPPIEQATFQGVDYAGLSTDLQQRAAAVMAGIQSGQKLGTDQIARLRANIVAIDASLRLTVEMRTEASGEAALRLHVLGADAVGRPPQRIRVGDNVTAANLIHRVEPDYPSLARSAGVQGTVRLDVIIGKEGSVERINVVSGHPLLIPAAMEAVRQYKYRQTMLNGQPVEVQTGVEVNFTL